MQSQKIKNGDWLAEKIIKFLVPVIFFLPLLVTLSHYSPDLSDKPWRAKQKVDLST